MRRRMTVLAGALALAAAPLTSQVLAQPGGASGATLPFATQQSANEFLARVFIGQAVHNTAGERLGDVNDLAFDRKGHISTVVIGVGGFLGMGEKSVGVPFSALTLRWQGRRARCCRRAHQTGSDASARLQGDRKDYFRKSERAGDRLGPEGRRQGRRVEGPGQSKNRVHEEQRASQAITPRGASSLASLRLARDCALTVRCGGALDFESGANIPLWPVRMQT